nr:MAG TPA: hypothetical protein [Caudoviricetes sp.]
MITNQYSTDGMKNTIFMEKSEKLILLIIFKFLLF